MAVLLNSIEITENCGLSQYRPLWGRGQVANTNLTPFARHFNNKKGLSMDRLN